MSEDFVVAKRYAKALILLSDTDDQQKERLATLNGIYSAFKATNIFPLLENPLFDKIKQQGLLDAVFETLKVKDDTLKKYLNVLVEEKRFSILGKILNVYEKLLNEKFKIYKVNLTVVDENNISSKLKELVDNIAKKTGVNLQITTKQDPSILGGAVIEFNDSRIDLSVKSELNKIILHAAR